MQDFFSMGGYGAYVWGSYGLTAVVMLALLVSSIRSLKSSESTFERLKLAMAPKEMAPKKDQKTETPNGDEA